MGNGFPDGVFVILRLPQAAEEFRYSKETRSFAGAQDDKKSKALKQPLINNQPC